jgi:hypothetical protein
VKHPGWSISHFRAERLGTSPAVVSARLNKRLIMFNVPVGLFTGTKVRHAKPSSEHKVVNQSPANTLPLRVSVPPLNENHSPYYSFRKKPTCGHFACRRGSLPQARLFDGSLLKPHAPQFSPLSPGSFVRLLSHAAVVVAARLRHLRPSAEPDQQLGHFLKQRARDRLTVQMILLTTHVSSRRRHLVESKSTAGCEMPIYVWLL